MPIFQNLLTDIFANIFEKVFWLTLEMLTALIDCSLTNEVD